LAVYAHGGPDSIATTLVNHAFQRMPGQVARVLSHKDACLLVAVEGSYGTFDELARSDAWYGGQNHLI